MYALQIVWEIWLCSIVSDGSALCHCLEVPVQAVVLCLISYEAADPSKYVPQAIVIIDTVVPEKCRLTSTNVEHL